MLNRSIPILGLLLLRALSACSLAGDVTPPPGYQAPAAVQPVSTGPSYPLVPPDPAQGASIYLEKCAPCHGITGEGDGPQAGQLPNPTAPIGSAELARESKPSEWYQVITTGRLERFMPGFVNSLSDRQRWDVLAYVYSLSAPFETLAEGEAIYQRECSECHGPAGGGNGPKAASLETAPSNFLDRPIMTQKSLAQFYQVITEGSAPAMPAYQEALNEDERWAAAAYIRNFSMGSGLSGQQASAPAVQPAPTTQATSPAGTEQPTPAPNEDSTTWTVMGEVVNGSAGEVPAGLTVTLHGYDEMREAYTQTTQVQEDGSFRFENIEMLPGRVFFATVDYHGTVFNSDIAHSTRVGEEIALPIVIFDNTSETTSLRIDRMHIFFDFSEPGTVQVAELFVVSNPTNKMVVSPGAGEPVIHFDLPQGASELQFQEGVLGERYVQTDSGFGDTASIYPGSGQHQVLFAYQLPYERNLDVDLSLPLPVEAAVVMVPQAGIKVQGDLLQDSGERSVQGMNFRLYTANNLPAGGKLNVRLSGKPSTGEELAGVSTGSASSLILGLGAFGLALTVAGIWIFRQRIKGGIDAEVETEEDAVVEANPALNDAESLMDAIIAVDDLYRSGKLPEAAYRERRAQLKALLREKMD